MDPHIWPSKTERPARTYIRQLCEDTGCSPEDLPEEIGNSGERGSGISVPAARHDDDDDDDDYLTAILPVAIVDIDIYIYVV